MAFDNAHSLEDVIDRLEEILDWIDQNRATLLPSELQDSSHRAWDDLKLSRAIPDLKEQITDLSEGELQSAGLSSSGGTPDPQLAFKLKSLNRSLAELRKRSQSILRRGQRSLWLKWLRRVLKRLDIILESLLKALGVSNPLEELKKVIEEEIGDLEEDESR